MNINHLKYDYDKKNYLTLKVRKFVNIKNTNSVKLFESEDSELNILNCEFIKLQLKEN